MKDRVTEDQAPEHDLNIEGGKFQVTEDQAETLKTIAEAMDKIDAYLARNQAGERSKHYLSDEVVLAMMEDFVNTALAGMADTTDFHGNPPFVFAQIVTPTGIQAVVYCPPFARKEILQNIIALLNRELERLG